MEFNAILSIEPCPHKDVFWLHLSSGFRIEIDALEVFIKWGREKFEKFKIVTDLIDPGKREPIPYPPKIAKAPIILKKIDSNIIREIKAALEEIKKIRNAKSQ